MPPHLPPTWSPFNLDPGNAVSWPIDDVQVVASTSSSVLFFILFSWTRRKENHLKKKSCCLAWEKRERKREERRKEVSLAWLAFLTKKGRKKKGFDNKFSRKSLNKMEKPSCPDIEAKKTAEERKQRWARGRWPRIVQEEEMIRSSNWLACRRKCPESCRKKEAVHKIFVALLEDKAKKRAECFNSLNTVHCVLKWST